MLPIKIDHIEFYVSNAFQAASFYKSFFGFNIISYAGPTTGMQDKISYLLKQGNITLTISSSINPDSYITKHILKHDDSIKDIVLLTEDVHSLFAHSIANGATPVMHPTEIDDGKTKIIKATITTFGDTVHSFIQKQDDNLPFYKVMNSEKPYTTHNMLNTIDHLAIAVEAGSIKKWQKFYQDTLGFHLFFSEEVDLGPSGMKSLVMANKEENIKLVFVEPISRQERSQVDNYLLHNNGPGVQHIAYLTQDIVNTIKYITKQGIEFLKVPASYYAKLDQTMARKLGQQKIEQLKKLGILIDGASNSQEAKILMQTFTKPLQNKPTFFAEIIERNQNNGFGSGNMKRYKLNRIRND